MGVSNSLLGDALAAWVHYVCIFALASTLAIELVLYRRSLSAAFHRTLRAVDGWYGILAGVVVASGLARIFLSPKGAAYFTHNPIFWTKMGLFALIALISIVPTVHFLRLKPDASGAVAIPAATYQSIRALLWIEAVLFVCLPLCASFLARGYH